MYAWGKYGTFFPKNYKTALNVELLLSRISISRENMKNLHEIMQSFRFSNVCFWSYLTRTILEIILRYFIIVKIISDCPNYFTIVKIILFICSVLACSWSTGVGGCQTWKPILTATSTESGGESNFSAMLILGVGSEEGLDWIISSQCTASQRNVSKTLFHVFVIFADTRLSLIYHQLFIHSQTHSYTTTCHRQIFQFWEIDRACFSDTPEAQLQVFFLG